MKTTEKKKTLNEATDRDYSQSLFLLKLDSSELLLRNRKFNQMEIEMDKFLAKKNPIFNYSNKAKVN